MADEGGGPGTGPSRPRGFAGRFSTSFLKPPVPSTSVASEPGQQPTDAEKRRAILGLDPLERKVGLIGAVIAGLLALITKVPYIQNPHKAAITGAGKNHSCVSPYRYSQTAHNCQAIFPRSHWVEGLALMVVFALAILITVRIGRRGPFGFVTLMAGLAFQSEVGVLGLPYIVGGGWLLMRAWRVQRFGSPTGSKSNPTGERRPPPTRAERATRAKKSKTTQPTGPVPSKRYTPKSKPKRRPPATTPPGS